jgi:hypothetical protein
MTERDRVTFAEEAAREARQAREGFRKLLSETVGAEPGLATSAVARAVKKNNQQVFDQLKAMHREGLLRSKKRGNANYWYPPDHADGELFQ